VGAVRRLSSKPGTSVNKVCDFVEKVFVRQDLADFKGDAAYLRDKPAQNWFGMARHSTAALYQWRCVHAAETQEKQRMLHEALLAYEQSFALDPTLVMDFADMLIQINQPQNARRLLQLSFKLDPDSQLRSMIDKLDRPENK